MAQRPEDVTGDMNLLPSTVVCRGERTARNIQGDALCGPGFRGGAGMAEAASNLESRTWSLGSALLLATLVAGTLDIGYAIGSSALRGIEPTVIWQSVASGLLGKATYEGGVKTALLGGVLHYAIMTSIALTFFLLSRRWPRLLEHPFLWGALYGVGVFCVMNYIVVPLSAIGQTFQRPPLRFIGEMFSHVVFVGMTIAWFASRVRSTGERLA